MRPIVAANLSDDDILATVAAYVASAQTLTPGFLALRREGWSESFISTHFSRPLRTRRAGNPGAYVTSSPRW